MKQENLESLVKRARMLIVDLNEIAGDYREDWKDVADRVDRFLADTREFNSRPNAVPQRGPVVCPECEWEVSAGSHAADCSKRQSSPQKGVDD